MNRLSIILKGILRITLLLFVITNTVGCNQKRSAQTTDNETKDSNGAIKYASGFEIIDYDNYTKVIINNPWDKNSSKSFATYYLYNEDNSNIPDNDGFKIKVPINSVIVNTFSYFEFLHQLGDLEKVVAVTDAARVYNKSILEGLKSGKIEDLGDPFNPNIEKTLMLKADAIINSAFVQQDNLSERAQKTGLPVIFSLEWMEASPLAKAEWIKLIAEFLDKREEADKIFTDIEKRYKKNLALVENIENKPFILAGDNFQDTWYIPGGKSFNAHFFKDAGANYAYYDNNETGSIGLDIESILTQFAKADVWIGCESDSYAELEKKDSKYRLLQPVKNKRVFNNRNRITESGGNDYFESTIAYPDLILQDLIKAIHPNILSEEPFTYIKPLK